MTHKQPSGWRCPVCGRLFARKSQAHSCKVATLETHLEKASPAVRRIHRALEKLFAGFGPYQAVPTKSQINYLSRTSFAGVRIRRDRLNLGFILAREVADQRFSNVQQISRRTYAYEVQLCSPADIDSKLRRWLREAYEVGLAAGRRDR